MAPGAASAETATASLGPTGVLSVTITGAGLATVSPELYRGSVLMCGSPCDSAFAGIDSNDVTAIDITCPSGAYVGVPVSTMSNTKGPVPVTIHSPSMLNMVDVTADEGWNDIHVTASGNSITVQDPSGTYHTTLDLHAIRHFGFEGTTGPDVINMSRFSMAWSKPPTPYSLGINLLKGDDSFVGPHRSHGAYVDGGAGNDRITTYEGNDEVHLGTGANVVNTGSGDDTVYASTGNDQIVLGPGNDYASDPGGATSLINGGAGNDVINTKATRVTVYGGSGNDQIVANSRKVKRARVYGGAGDDYIDVQPSIPYTVNCGSGNDRLGIKLVHAIGCEHYTVAL
jgi:Ca2+-binding RTX toxin-like protein